MCICVYLRHFDVQQKLAYCKSTILQLSKEKSEMYREKSLCCVTGTNIVL